MIIIDQIGDLVIKINIRVRRAISLACLVAIFLIFFIRIMEYFVSWPFYFNDAQWNTIGFIFLLAFAIFSIERKFEKVIMNKAFLIIFLAPAIYILISSFTHHIGDGLRVYSIIIMLLPCVYYIFACQNLFFKLFQMLSWGAIISGCCFIIICIVFAPVDYFFISIFDLIGEKISYHGPTSNPNRTGYYAMACFLGGLYLLTTTEIKKSKGIIKIIFLSLTMSLLFGIILLTGCRAAILIIFISIVICVIFLIRHIAFPQLIAPIIIILILIIVSTPLTTLLLGIPSDEYTVEVKKENDLRVANEKNIVYEAYGSVIYEMPKLPETDHPRLNSMLSGRVKIWQYYIGELNIWGHDVHQIPGSRLMIGGHDDGRKPSDIQFYAPHNIPLDIAYRCGVIAGILHLLFMIYLALYSIKMMLSRKMFNPVTLFSCIMSIVYFLYGVQAMEWIHFHFLVIFLFFMSIGPYMFKLKA